MPILRGVSREDHAAQGEETEALFREAIGVLAAWREAGLEKRAPVSEVVVDRVEGMTVFCGREPVAVKLGVGEVPEKLGRLDQLLTELQRRGARAEVVRLDNRARPGWVAVQLAQASGGLQ